MSIQNLSPRQIQALKAIADHKASQHCSPTIKQLAEILAISRTTAYEHIAALREKGLLKASTGKARCLTLTQSASQLLEQFELDVELDTVEYAGDSVPLLGLVAAGSPIEAIQSDQGLSLRDQFGSNDVFALRVAGDSMVEDDIQHGDYIICKKSQTARNGQLAVLIVDEDSATVKRFYREKDHARLEPANKDYQPIITSNCRVEAIVLGLVRTF